MAQNQKIGKHKTRVLFGNHRHVVQYHDTNVVIYDGHNVSLDSGGFKTATTKRRMNQASAQWNIGYHVYQRDFEWFVSFPLSGMEDIPFVDRMKFSKSKI